jgi:membrane-associated phospholipid phosphatase
MRADKLSSLMARAWYLSSRWLPQGWFDALRQLVLFAGAYYLYRLVRGLIEDQVGTAFANARALVDVERSVGLFFEPGLQSWALTQGWLIDWANWMYTNAHVLVTTGFLIWMYLARNHAYYYVRNMFMIAMGLALVLYAAFPTAPPRFLPEWGFTDTVTSFLGETTAQTAGLFYNPFAAVPSMHIAFALMVAVPAYRLVKSRLMRAVWALYAPAVAVVVLVTANHWWLDIVFGAGAAAISAYTALALARARPEAWAWRTASPVGARATA